MKILMVNKFLYPFGGTETYVMKLGEALTDLGHQVQYFGMDHPDRCMGNAVGAYTKSMDFHNASRAEMLTYPFRIIYSRETRKKIRMVLEDFQPDVCHLNNINYQLTPSLILEIEKWRKEAGHPCRIVSTIHDHNLICPNHMLNNPITLRNCNKCLGGHFWHCAADRCIHCSRARSLLGSMEAYFWKWMGVYRYLDVLVCPSAYMKGKMDTNPLFAEKTVVLRNFAKPAVWKDCVKKDYVLYFGRYVPQKGLGNLLQICRELPQIPFIFAGNGPMAQEMEGIPNLRNVGFQSGEALEQLIREARFSVCPSEAYDNCPFSVIESLMYGTPVVGADIGGIPELIDPGKTGLLFECGNRDQLRQQILSLWEHPEQTEQMHRSCRSLTFDTVTEYTEKLMKIYENAPSGF